MHGYPKCSRCEISDFNARREGKDHMKQSSLSIAFCLLQTEMKQCDERQRERDRQTEKECVNWPTCICASLQTMRFEFSYLNSRFTPSLLINIM